MLVSSTPIFSSHATKPISFPSSLVHFQHCHLSCLATTTKHHHLNLALYNMFNLGKMDLLVLDSYLFLVLHNGKLLRYLFLFCYFWLHCVLKFWLLLDFEVVIIDTIVFWTWYYISVLETQLSFVLVYHIMKLFVCNSTFLFNLRKSLSPLSIPSRHAVVNGPLPWMRVCLPDPRNLRIEFGFLHPESNLYPESK